MYRLHHSKTFTFLLSVGYLQVAKEDCWPVHISDNIHAMSNGSKWLNR